MRYALHLGLVTVPSGRRGRAPPVTELADWALAQRTSLVVITGGEPLLQQAALVPLTARLAAQVGGSKSRPTGLSCLRPI